LVILGSVAILIAMAVVFLACAIAMGNAHAEMEDAQLIEDPPLLDAIRRECATLRSELDASSSRGADKVLEENGAVADFVARVQAATSNEARDNDPPTNDWLVDWLKLVAVRDRYARELRTSEGADRRPVPRVDGVPITDRMNSAVLECKVPSDIADDFAR